MEYDAWALELVGGPYDGMPEVWWVQLVDDGELPAMLLIGKCSGGGACSARNCPGDHPFAWDADAVEPPPLPTVPYRRAEVRDESATYVYAGIGPVWRDEARERELLMA